ncbi:MAG: thermopsin family protease, partial [Thermoplasmata archaeon]
GPPRSAELRTDAGPVDPYAVYDAEPAPMGLADYGLDGGGSPYAYATPGLRGIANITEIEALNATYASNFVTFELNANLELTGPAGEVVLWAESVAELNTSSGFIVFFDAIWNETSSGASLVPGAIVGNGTIASAVQRVDYTDTAGLEYPGSFAAFPQPGILGLELSTSNSSTGVPEIRFGYEAGAGWVSYDTASVILTGGLRSDGFVVDGSAYTPATTFFDSEFVLGGAGQDGATGLTEARLSLALEYFTGHDYTSVRNAWNFGSDASVGVSNTVSGSGIDATTGRVGAEVGTGSGSLGPLYNSSSVGELSLATTLPNGSIDIDGAAYGPFNGTPIRLTAPPGPMNVSLRDNGFLFGSIRIDVVAGSTVFGNVTTQPLAVIEFRSVGLPAG